MRTVFHLFVNKLMCFLIISYTNLQFIFVHQAKLSLLFSREANMHVGLPQSSVYYVFSRIYLRCLFIMLQIVLCIVGRFKFNILRTEINCAYANCLFGFCA